MGRASTLTKLYNDLYEGVTGNVTRGNWIPPSCLRGFAKAPNEHDQEWFNCVYAIGNPYGMRMDVLAEVFMVTAGTLLVS